ncbi:hypothetical protein [Rhodococcus gannanensis]|uniref:Mce-associated membrane protein n=1 Tax=Rhodococcus gannanensis TaxID=1960308 RepID=A0ABW4P9K7_9NOCA
MPPQRRNTNPTPSKGRTPKIAGRQTPRGDHVAPADTDRREPELREPTPAIDATPAPAASTTDEGTDRPAPDRGADAVEDAPTSSDAAVSVSEGPSDATAGESSDTTASEEPQSRARPVYRASSLRPRPQEPDEGDAAEDAATVAAGWRRVAVVGAVAVALAVFAVIAWLRPGGEVDNRAWVDDAETMQVTAAARDAIQTLYTYGFETVDQDFDAARGVLSDDMRSQFDQTAQVTRDAVIQTKTKTNAEVTDIGVKLLSDDHAELVATMNVSATNDGAAQGSASGPLSVTMTRVDGEWLLADIRDR